MSDKRLARALPCLVWLKGYGRQTFARDLLAALLVCILLVPQSLAYALLAGLPPQAGLYASILPLIAYTLFGSSRTMSVGPVAVLSLMTAAAIGKLAGSTDLPPVQIAMLLALLSGALLLGLGLLRAGFLANFLSHPVVAGFITASALIIVLGQFEQLLGIRGGGSTLPALLESSVRNFSSMNLATASLGIGTLLFLLWARHGMKTLLSRTGLSTNAAHLLTRIAPVLAVIVTSLLAWQLELDAAGVVLLGEVPSGLPGLQLPSFTPEV